VSNQWQALQSSLDNISLLMLALCNNEDAVMACLSRSGIESLSAASRNRNLVNKALYEREDTAFEYSIANLTRIIKAKLSDPALSDWLVNFRANAALLPDRGRKESVESKVALGVVDEPEPELEPAIRHNQAGLDFLAGLALFLGSFIFVPVLLVNLCRRNSKQQKIRGEYLFDLLFAKEGPAADHAAQRESVSKSF